LYTYYTLSISHAGNQLRVYLSELDYNT